jgi:hypothetical protein
MVGLRITLAARVTFYKRPNQQPVLLTLFSRRPSQSLSWEVVDGEGMVQTANRTLRLRTASAAASANLKRLVRVRLYPARTMFCSGVELSSLTSICVITSWCGTTYCNTFVSGRSRPY